MERPYIWQTNEWGESEKKYLDNDPPPSLGMPDSDMGGICEDAWRSHREWQRRNQTFILDVQYEGDEGSRYDKL